MPRLIAAILRHGEYQQLADTPSAHQPFPLTESGFRQARAAAAPLLETCDARGWHLHPVIDSSNLLRGWQTARDLADTLAELSGQRFEVEGHDALAERGLGSAANLSVARIEDIVEADPRFPPLPANWKSDSHFRLPLQGAESLIDAGARVAAHMRRRMEEMAARVDRDTVRLFVGHGAAFRHAAYHLGAMALDDVGRFSMYHARPIYLLAGDAGTPWRQVAGEWKLRSSSADRSVLPD
ncbi:MAG: histidine phosphatase family protein [Gammaproteobacteria bacterium]|nr:histidine phosphatase family protein [Gammaproteobacteria bacterium]